MAGNKAGGMKAAMTNKERHGEDFYVRMGRVGGRKGKADGTIKGFGANPALARTAGAKGGSISRRRKYEII